MVILGIETSCDETAAALLRNEREVLSNVVASQIDVHRQYGGVVPELASREHIRNIDYIVDRAFAQAGLKRSDIHGIAVTQGPGLIGSLLVGLSYAKAMAYLLQVPVVPVNHIEGHICSAYIENQVEWPVLALVVSGGHTALYFSPEPERYIAVARTRDDAAGEAFDKVAKLLGLGYPGGPIIDKLSEKGDPRAVPFSVPRFSDGSLDFSFSGLKTAALRWVQAHGIVPLRPGEEPGPQVLNLAASFQRVVVDTLLDRTRRAAEKLAPRSITITGGVACNRLLRSEFARFFGERGVPVYYPRPIYTTDNAAMIAAAGYPKLKRRLEERGRGSGSAAQDLALNAYANLILA